VFTPDYELLTGANSNVSGVFWTNANVAITGLNRAGMRLNIDYGNAIVEVLSAPTFGETRLLFVEWDENGPAIMNAYNSLRLGRDNVSATGLPGWNTADTWVRLDDLDGIADGLAGLGDEGRDIIIAVTVHNGIVTARTFTVYAPVLVITNPVAASSIIRATTVSDGGVLSIEFNATHEDAFLRDIRFTRNETAGANWTLSANGNRIVQIPFARLSGINQEAFRIHVDVGYTNGATGPSFVTYTYSYNEQANTVLNPNHEDTPTTDLAVPGVLAGAADIDVWNVAGNGRFAGEQFAAIQTLNGAVRFTVNNFNAGRADVVTTFVQEVCAVCGLVHAYTPLDRIASRNIFVVVFAAVNTQEAD
jgi:hypothetical protein